MGGPHGFHTSYELLELTSGLDIPALDSAPIVKVAPGPQLGLGAFPANRDDQQDLWRRVPFWCTELIVTCSSLRDSSSSCVCLPSILSWKIIPRPGKFIPSILDLPTSESYIQLRYLQDVSTSPPTVDSPLLSTALEASALCIRVE